MLPDLLSLSSGVRRLQPFFLRRYINSFPNSVTLSSILLIPIFNNKSVDSFHAYIAQYLLNPHSNFVASSLNSKSSNLLLVNINGTDLQPTLLGFNLGKYSLEI